MKPAPRLTVEPIATVPQPMADMAHSIASFGAFILAVGGIALLLFAAATQ